MEVRASFHLPEGAFTLSTPRFVNLGIGDLFCDPGPAVVSTILGSCVSVSLFSQRMKAGGIIHFALPDRGHAANSPRSDLNFGDSAIKALVRELLCIPGVTKGDLVAKIVGGASVVNELSHSAAIGDLNVEMARKTLGELGISVIGEDVGGVSGRKVFFYSDSGRLRVSRINEEKKLPQSKGPAKKVRVLIVDDSRTVRDILVKILSCDQIEVVGKAENALEADKLIRSLVPDVITLDIHMPGVDGVTFLQKYLPQHAIPTVMISSISMNESDLILRALEIGAVDYIQKPSLAEITTQSDFIREKILTAASIKVSRRREVGKRVNRSISYSYSGKNGKVVAIGASTGGTEAIKTVLLSLPKNIPPIVIVQHIPPVFSTAFVKRLNELCPFEVIEGRDGDEVIPGRVIIAPGGRQMELVIDGGRRKVHVFDGERVNRHRPSVDVLFKSVAKVLAKESLGVILTGMGNDGAMGLLEMRKAGAHTIGQDEASSVVYGMPKAAYQLSAVAQVCSLEDVALEIVKNLEAHKVA